MNKIVEKLNARLADSLHNDETLPEIAGVVLDELEKFTQASKSTFVLCTQQPIVRATAGTEGEAINEMIRSRVKGFDDVSSAHLLRPLDDDEVVKRVFDGQKPQIWKNMDESAPKGWEKLEITEEIKSWIAIPLLWFDQPVGLITLADPQPGKFAAVRVNDLKEFAELSANAIHTCLLARNQKALCEIMQETSLIYEVEKILQTIAEKIHHLFNNARCTIFQRLDDKEDRSHIFLQSWVNERDKSTKELRFDEGEGIAGWVLKYKKSRSVPDTENPMLNRDFIKIAGHSDHPRSILAVPIEVNGYIIGVICVDDEKSYNFSKYALDLVNLVASQVAAVIERTLALNLVGKTLPEINRSGEPREIIRRVIEKAAEMANAVSGTVHIVEKDRDTWRVIDKVNYPPSFNPPTSRLESADPETRKQSLLFGVLEKQEMVKVDARLINDLLRKQGIRATIGVPLFYEGAAIGVLSLNFAREPKFSKVDEETVKIFAAQAANAIQKSTLVEKLEQKDQAQKILIHAIYHISKTAASQSQQAVFELIVNSVLDLIVPRPMFCHLGLVKNIEADQVVEFLATSPSEDREGLNNALKLSLNHGSEANGGKKGIAGYAIIHKKAVLISNTEAMESDLKNNWYIRITDKTKSELTVPIIDATLDKAIGVINIEHDKPNALNENHQLIVEAFADQLALVIRGQDQANAMALKQDQYQSLIDTNRTLMAAAPIGFINMARTELEKTTQSLGAAAAVVQRVERTKGKPGDRTAPGTKKDLNVKGIISTIDGEEIASFQENRAKNVFLSVKPGFIHAPDDFEANSAMKSMGFQSAICLPLDTGNNLVGVIWFIYKDQQSKRYEEDKQILSLYANVYALAIENWFTTRRAKELEEQLDGMDQKFTDDYTNARNQQFVQFIISAVIGVAGAMVLILSVAMKTSDPVGRTISAIGGGLTMAIGTLIYARADIANKRSDKYHKEQLRFRQLRFLFNSTGLVTEAVRQQLQQEFMHGAFKYWFTSKPGKGSRGKPVPTEETQEKSP